MTSRPRLRGVLFDVGNTLLYPYPSVSHVCREILLATGEDRDLAAIESLMPLVDEYYEDRYRADDAFWTNEEETSEVWVGMYSLLYRRLGIDGDAATLARAVYDAFGSPSRWRAYDDVVPAFLRLQAVGLRIGILSNWDARLEGILDGVGIGAYADTIVSSSAVGLRKPDPRIFELACARLSLTTAECAHVGDHMYADVLGARAAGLAPVLIDRKGTGYSGSVPRVRTLDDLEDALR